MLSDKDIYLDAIAIQETWLPENTTLYDSVLKIPGYKAIPQGYICGKKRGASYILEG